MKINHGLFAVLLSSVSFAANAAVSASIACAGTIPTITLSYSMGSDAGLPGVTYVGLVTPDNQSALILNLYNSWIRYEGGQYAPNGVFESGLPSARTIKATLPNGGTSTGAYAGHSLYAGIGALGAYETQLVRQRREALDRAKPELVARGAWPEQYQTDDMFKLTMAEKNMKDGNKYSRVLTIPALDCNPSGS